MRITRLISLTAVLDEAMVLTSPKDSLISDAIDEITCFSIKNEHSMATEYAATEKEKASDKSCNSRPDVSKNHNA